MSSASKVAAELAVLNERTWLHIGRLAEVMMEPERAVVAYESALRHNPHSEETLTLIAALCRSLEQYAKAADFFHRILKINENNGEIWGALGHCYLMLDDLQKAYTAYQKALYYLPDPKEPKLWYGIGILYDRYGSYELAEEAFTAVIRMEPGFEKANEIYFRLGIIYKQERKFELALDCFKHILTCPPSPLTEVDIWFQIGHLYEQQKEYQLAREAYEKVLSENPKHAKVLQQLGWLYQQSNTPFCSQDRAVAYLRQSLDSDMADPQTWYLLGRCYMSQQKYNEAYDAYQQAVYRDGGNPTFWCSIGVLYYQINQYADALDAYSRAIRLNPNISEVWYDLGTLYESCNNQLSDALDAYTRALELDPDNVQIKQRLQLLRSAQASGTPVQALQPQQPTPSDRHPVVSGIQTGPSPHYQNREYDGVSGQSMHPPPPFGPAGGKGGMGPATQQHVQHQSQHSQQQQPTHQQQQQHQMHAQHVHHPQGAHPQHHQHPLAHQQPLSSQMHHPRSSMDMRGGPPQMGTSDDPMAVRRFHPMDQQQHQSSHASHGTPQSKHQ